MSFSWVMLGRLREITNQRPYGKYFFRHLFDLQTAAMTVAGFDRATGQCDKQHMT